MHPALWMVLLLAATAAYAQDAATEKEKSLGRHIAANIRRASPPLNLPRVQSWIERIGTALATRFRTGISWSFELTSDKSAREPLAAPGGFVFVPAGAILASAGEREFIRALAHHMAHAATPATLTRSENGSIPLIFMGGSAGQGHGAIVPRAFAGRAEQLEREAEALAAEAIEQAGDLYTGEFTQIQDEVRGQLKPPRRPPSLYRK